MALGLKSWTRGRIRVREERRRHRASALCCHKGEATRLDAQLQGLFFHRSLSRRDAVQMGAPLASCCCQWVGGGGLVNKNRSMSIGLEEDASGRGFDLGLIKSSLFHFSLTRGLFLFLDQRPVPTLSHQSPSPMVPTDQTPDTTNKLSLTCGPATPPTLFRGNGPPPTNHSRNSACRGWRKRESTPPEPVRRRQPGGSQPHHRSHQHQWRSSCSRRGSRKDVISPCPVRPARHLACERREPKRPTYQVLKLSSTCCLLRSLSRSLTP